MKITRKQLRLLITEQIATVTSAAIDQAVLQKLDAEGGAAGADPLVQAVKDLAADEDIELPEELQSDADIEERLLDVPGVAKHEDGDYVNTAGLSEISSKTLKSIIEKL